MLMADALAHAAASLRLAGVENPMREARLLLAHLLHRPASTWLSTTPQDIDPLALQTILASRAARKPLAYITGTRGFWTFDVEVSPATLIPRPDSETLISAALAHLPDRTGVRRVLDLGTGTGCLLLAALLEYPNAVGTGTDLNPEAAALAARNAARLGLSARAHFLAANWADPIDGAFDLILCNPPYIETATLSALMPEVADHEPASALDGGTDGLRAYAVLIPGLRALLAPGGLACLELGAGQAQAVTALARRAGLTRIATKPDLAGHDRALLLA